MLGMIKMAEADLLRCCGATLWARAMAAHAFPNPKEVLATADSVWWSLDASAWIEAFRAHPRVGERAESKWPQEEQYATRHASHETMAELREANHRYEERFGFPFVMSASGKTADQMLKALRERMNHELEAEQRIAAEQERQIMHARLKRVLTR